MNMNGDNIRVPDTRNDRRSVLLDAMLSASSGEHPSRAIERQEAQGQRDLVRSTQLPVRGTQGKEELFSRLGIELGPVPTTGDTLFRDAKLPEGWQKRATDHSMWSHLVDAKGSVRASIFYKAAFYDRDAHIRLERRFSIRRDYDAGPTTLRWEVFDKLSDAVIHTYEVEAPHKDNDREAHYKFLNELEQQNNYKTPVESWMQENYPDYDDPMAYWN